MKAKRLILALASTTVLVACSGKGAEITQEEATEKATAISKKANASDFSSPNKYQVTSSMSMSTGSETLSTSVTIDFAPDDYYLAMTGTVNSESMKAYVYWKENVLYVVTNDTYFSVEASAEDAKKAFTEYAGETADAGSSMDIEELASAGATALEGLLNTIKMVEKAYSVISTDKVTLDFHYYSKGDGNLTIEANIAGTDIYDMTTSITIDNYLLTDYSTKMAGMESKLSVKWGNANITYPDVTKLSQVAAE
ncbi:MAG: hypothetical protein K6F32_02620 [Bacilli bacterium]|nr:hypothetical protein [Bacilli bacterium]